MISPHSILYWAGVRSRPTLSWATVTSTSTSRLGQDESTSNSKLGLDASTPNSKLGQDEFMPNFSWVEAYQRWSLSSDPAGQQTCMNQLTRALFCKANFETEQGKKALPSEDEDNGLNTGRRILFSSSSFQSLLPLFLCFLFWVLSSVFSSVIPLLFFFLLSVLPPPLRCAFYGLL
jgi:hypothetical protein